MIKISVVVPTYNVEKYIIESLQSILSQTLQDIELLVIDDGSTDNTLKVIQDNFSDSRIKIVKKENGGASSARNLGITLARGEYISFIDSDDIIEKDMLEKLYNNSNGKDIVFCDYLEFEDGNESVTRSENYLKKYKYLNLLAEVNPIYVYIPELTVVVNKIYKKNFLKEKNIFFTEGIIHEDVEFSLKIFMLAKSYKYLNEALYKYRKNRSGSVMKEADSKKLNFAYETIYKNLLDFEKLFEKGSFARTRVALSRIRVFGESFYYSDKNLSCELAKKIKNEIKNYLQGTELDSIKKKKIIMNDLNWIYKNKMLLKKTSLWDLLFWNNNIKMYNIFIRGIKNKR